MYNSTPETNEVGAQRRFWHNKYVLAAVFLGLTVIVTTIVVLLWPKTTSDVSQSTQQNISISTPVTLSPPSKVSVQQLKGSTGVLLSWQATTSTNPIAHYNIYRNGSKIGTATSLTYTDKTAVAGRTYTYRIRAVDITGAKSGLSQLISITLSGKPATSPASRASNMRVLPNTLYGMTMDDVSNVSNIVAAAKAAPHMPIIRIVFDEDTTPSDYSAAIAAIQPHSYIMGELLDSYYLPKYTTSQFHKRTAEFLKAFGSSVDIWEIGNEVNGNWTGSYASVSAKITDAYAQVHAAGKRAALTLYYDIGCGNGPSELDPIAFTKKYVPAIMRQGLDYVFLSYYEADCNNIRLRPQTWTNYFNQLHQLYPNSKLGFGEVGLPDPATSKTLSKAQAMLKYYYGLKLSVPNYVGGYFWWYAYEDFLPISLNKPLWQTFIETTRSN